MAENLSMCCGSAVRPAYEAEIEQGLTGFRCTNCGGEIDIPISPREGRHTRYYRAANHLLAISMTEPKGIIVEAVMESLPGRCPHIGTVAALFNHAISEEYGKGFSSNPIEYSDLTENGISITVGMSGRRDYWAKRPRYVAFGQTFDGGYRHILHVSMENKCNDKVEAHGEKACSDLILSLAHEYTKMVTNRTYPVTKVVEVVPITHEALHQEYKDEQEALSELRRSRRPRPPKREYHACSMCGNPTKEIVGSTTADWYLCDGCKDNPQAEALGYTHNK